MIFKILLNDAIRSVITDKYILSEIDRNINYFDDGTTTSKVGYIKRRIIQLVTSIVDNINDERSIDNASMIYNLSDSSQIDRNICKRITLRILSSIRNSHYYKYCKILDDDTNYGMYRVIIDIGLDDYDKEIQIGSYKMYGYDIIKHQYQVYKNVNGRKYQMLSDSLYNKVIDIIDKLPIDSTCELKRAKDAEEIRKLNATTRTLRNTNFFVDTTRNYTINSKGQMTYTPKGKITIMKRDEEDGASIWTTTNRQEMKYGKAIRQIYCRKYLPPISDTMVQTISQKLKAIYTFDAEIVVVDGKDIQKYYHHSAYNNTMRTESLQNSCMRHSSCEDFFALYVDNPNKVQMAIAKTPDGIIGRALMWTTDNGTKIMDRIYGNEITINAIKNYAHQWGYMHKRVQSYHNDTEFVSPIGEAVDSTYEITLNNKGNLFPYMDTFKYTMDIESSEIIITNNSDSDDYVLDSTEGGPGNLTQCVDGRRYHEDDVTYIEYGNVEEGYYHNDDTAWCEWSSESYHTDDMINTVCGNWVYRDCNDLIYLEDDDTYCHMDDSVYSEYLNIYLLAEKAVECPIKGWIPSNISTVLTVDGEQYDVLEGIELDELKEHINNEENN